MNDNLDERSRATIEAAEALIRQVEAATAENRKKLMDVGLPIEAFGPLIAAMPEELRALATEGAAKAVAEDLASTAEASATAKPKRVRSTI